MFQRFESVTRPADGPPRLAALRAEMRRAGIDGFLVPRADMYQGEYVAPHDDRLAWLTGFTGSAGFAAALMDRAGVFIDGRYRVQVRQQIAPEAFAPVHWPEVGLADWLREALPDGGTVGFDPWLHTFEQIDQLLKGLEGSGITLSETANLIDRIWHDQPAPPTGAIVVHPDDLAGESHAAKRARLGAALHKAGQGAAVITLPDSIAWLLNIRGSDIPRNPVPHATAILQADGHVTLFTDPAKIDDALRSHLFPDITLRPATAFEPALRSLTGTVRVDRASAPFAVTEILNGAGVDLEWGQDPCILPKACKNAAEIDGSIRAHIRDGAAMVEFLSWLEMTLPGGRLTEIDVVTELEVCRGATGRLRDISFETIAGAGPNGAIVHYRVTRDSNRTITPGQLLLIDSGGQYRDGTTDITRTVPVGEVGQEEKECFTRVLQGMIAMSRVRFPRGVEGRHLDALARYPLWLAGQDYDHGTGHGVGSYLCVHEGPQRLSRISDVPLQPGMILSNEPGYYREGAFGIRIENLIVVEEAPDLGDGRPMLQFRTLTLAPIDRRLIVADMLSAEEREWLDAYHARVAHELGPLVSAGARTWLSKVTQPLPA
ncbi:aminopeptidase P family protein [Actibacterium sp. XHP0104]|uniref:aminopeptidase P family protein n=1 Tax=Actibacterium sp. XHP0104 TaxID=2984335 RepID=UPI0021E774C2|nr:aminopeptidase P family protein [Actibacterium sp. XHP0104]MCV2881343.1 aminopeptidase P family protein [Actibacterium sp. XHP0104]